jgi:hypothetical protein
VKKRVVHDVSTLDFPQKTRQDTLAFPRLFLLLQPTKTKFVGSNQNLDCNDKYSRDTVILLGKESDKEEEEGDV